MNWSVCKFITYQPTFTTLYQVNWSVSKFNCISSICYLWTNMCVSSSISLLSKHKWTDLCAPRLILGGIEGLGPRFHVLRSRTHFRRYRGCRDQFSCFTLSWLFWAVPRASGPVFGGTEGLGSRFYVLRSRTHFWRHRRHWVLFEWFAPPNSFWTEPRALGSVFILALPDPFWTVPRASFLVLMFCAFGLVLAVPKSSSPVFMFCAPDLVLCGNDGVGSRFHILRSRAHSKRYREHQISFSCFAVPNTV
jgi:hypothetical protein